MVIMRGHIIHGGGFKYNTISKYERMNFQVTRFSSRTPLPVALKTAYSFPSDKRKGRNIMFSNFGEQGKFENNMLVLDVSPSTPYFPI